MMKSVRLTLNMQMVHFLMLLILMVILIFLDWVLLAEYLRAWAPPRGVAPRAVPASSFRNTCRTKTSNLQNLCNNSQLRDGADARLSKEMKLLQLFFLSILINQKNFSIT